MPYLKRFWVYKDNNGKVDDALVVLKEEKRRAYYVMEPDGITRRAVWTCKQRDDFFFSNTWVYKDNNAVVVNTLEIEKEGNEHYIRQSDGEKRWVWTRGQRHNYRFVNTWVYKDNNSVALIPPLHPVIKDTHNNFYMQQQDGKLRQVWTRKEQRKIARRKKPQGSEPLFSVATAPVSYQPVCINFSGTQPLYASLCQSVPVISVVGYHTIVPSVVLSPVNMYVPQLFSAPHPAATGTVTGRNGFFSSGASFLPSENEPVAMFKSDRTSGGNRR